MRRAAKESVELDPTYVQINEASRTYAPGRFNRARDDALHSTEDLHTFFNGQIPLFPSLQSSLRRVSAALLLHPLMADTVNLEGGRELTVNVFALPWVLVCFFL
jgi:hypothetical protein